MFRPLCIVVTALVLAAITSMVPFSADNDIPLPISWTTPTIMTFGIIAVDIMVKEGKIPRRFQERLHEVLASILISVGLLAFIGDTTLAVAIAVFLSCLTAMRIFAEVWLLTTTADRFFEGLGWRRVDRSSAPAGMSPSRTRAVRCS